MSLKLVVRTCQTILATAGITTSIFLWLALPDLGKKEAFTIGFTAWAFISPIAFMACIILERELTLRELGKKGEYHGNTKSDCT